MAREHNRPVISTVLKTKAAKRDIPIPKCLVDCLREAKANSISEYVIADSEGQPLSYSQFTRVWQYVVVRSAKERTYYKYVNGQSIKYTVKPTLGTTQRNNPKIRYTLLTLRQFSTWQGMRIVRQLWTFTRGSSIINQRNFSR